MGTFGPVAFKVILRSFSTLAIFHENTICQKLHLRYSFNKSQPKFIKILLNYLLNGPHKTTFGTFDILKIEILTMVLVVVVVVLCLLFSFWLTWDPRGGKFQTATLLL